jgi:hypothetical protein
MDLGRPQLLTRAGGLERTGNVSGVNYTIDGGLIKTT